MAENDMIVAKQDEQGRVTVEGWPACIRMTREFLETADPRMVIRKGRILFFQVSNGAALYQITKRDREADVFWASRKDSFLTLKEEKPCG